MPVSITVESASVARARRRKRTAITLLVVIGLLAAAFYYASSYWTRGPSRASGGSACTVTADPSGPVYPTQVTVNVFNATSRTGLAASVGRLVSARGFVLGTVSNDPLRKSIPGTAEVRYGPAGERAAKLVQSLVPGATLLKDTRADASVDLVLGTAYKDLVTATGTASLPTAPPGC
jgi:hypothetical protein